jgi:CheY-like chemotaxis protein
MLEPLEPEPGARVLVVDDDPATVELWADVLDRRGFEVRSATDPKAAIELATSFQPSVAVLDLHLPSMDGHELALHLKRVSRDVRLIAVTGDGSDFARERSAARGFAAHLVKPVEIAALTRFVRTLAG